MIEEYNQSNLPWLVSPHSAVCGDNAEQNANGCDHSDHGGGSLLKITFIDKSECSLHPIDFTITDICF
jgi:hypothetical protein